MPRKKPRTRARGHLIIPTDDRGSSTMIYRSLPPPPTHPDMFGMAYPQRWFLPHVSYYMPRLHTEACVHCAPRLHSNTTPRHVHDSTKSRSYHSTTRAPPHSTTDSYSSAPTTGSSQSTSTSSGSQTQTSSHSTKATDSKTSTSTNTESSGTRSSQLTSSGTTTGGSTATHTTGSTSRSTVVSQSAATRTSSEARSLSHSSHCVRFQPKKPYKRRRKGKVCIIGSNNCSVAVFIPDVCVWSRHDHVHSGRLQAGQRWGKAAD